MKGSLHARQIAAFAEELDGAASHANAIFQCSLRQRFNVDDAYQIQHASIQRRVARGEQIIGVKMGFTSQAKMVQMGVSDQILGQLTDFMQIKSGAAISLGTLIHLRCEPEVAFLLSKDLDAHASLEETFDAIGGIAPAIEIIDSRYRQFRFSLVDVIADNASSAAFVLGSWVTPFRDLAGLNVDMTIDGKVRQRGSTTDILGNPLIALTSAARLAATQGIPLREGSIVLAGAATAAEPIALGLQVLVNIARLGEVRFSVSHA